MASWFDRWMQGNSDGATGAIRQGDAPANFQRPPAGSRPRVGDSGMDRSTGPVTGPAIGQESSLPFTGAGNSFAGISNSQLGDGRFPHAGLGLDDLENPDQRYAWNEAANERRRRWRERLGETPEAPTGFVDPRNAFKNDDWMRLYDVGDDITADGLYHDYEQKTGVSGDILRELGLDAASLSGAEGANAVYNAMLASGGKYDPNQFYNRTLKESANTPVPESWMGEIQHWSQPYQDQFAKAYETGDEVGWQNVRNMARAEQLAQSNAKWGAQTAPQGPVAPKPEPVADNRPPQAKPEDDKDKRKEQPAPWHLPQSVFY